MSEAVRSANTSFQSGPSRPASCTLESLPRCARTMRERRACSIREKPGMSAFESTYAECLWYWACAIESPISASRAAHSSIKRSGSSSRSAPGELGGFHARLVDLALGEILQAEAHAAHVERLGELRLESAADDELGRAAADVEHQATLIFQHDGRGQRVRHAQVDEARLLAARDYLDR